MFRPAHCHVRTWDIPTRIFHWAVVILVAGGWLSHKYGDFTLIWHKWNGYALLTLLLFRLMWGVVGSSTARFTQFPISPRSIFGYLRSGMHQKFLGHNPLGSLSVLALLLAMFVQAFSGLFATDDIIVNGPLRWLVARETASFLDSIHRQAYDILLMLVGLHLAAIFYYRFVRKDNLITPMITGYKCPEQVPEGAAAQWRPIWLALICLGIAAFIVWFGINVWRW
ncbi:MAG: cytochrome b/b6 domain-containing protein [Chromatiales bacterium]|nr:cytochrome b/b6 domain-containing protein [Gammaproteobacteria bacterium]MBW6475575.1 cytochrome b/b6 domain-containing protein [Chromatiales bacterium]